MAELMRDPAGKVWEERAGKWYQVSSERAGGALAAADMGLGESVLVGAGRELTRLGRGARGLMADVQGDKVTRAQIDELEREAREQIAGAKDAGKGFGVGLGEMLPGLATGGLGLTGQAFGRTLSAGARLLEQSGVSGVMGGIGHSGDQGIDAMTGALLGAAGFGSGALAGRVVSAIKQRGVEARAAIMDAAAAAREMGPPAPPGMGNAAGGRPAAGAGQGAGAGGAAGESAAAAGGAAEDPLRFGAATRPGAEGLAAGGGLPGAAPGAAGLTPELQRLAGRADDLGILLTPGARSGSIVQSQIEESLKSSPWSAGIFEQAQKQNVGRLNELAVRAIGEEGREITQQVLDRAHTRVGGVFQDAAETVGTVRASNEALQDAGDRLRSIISEASEGAAVVPEVERAASRLLGIWENAGQITGERLSHERSRLIKLARNYSRNGDQLASEGVHDVVGVIDDVIATRVPAAQRGRLVEARAQWRILAAIENGASIDAKSNVRAGSLFQGLQREFPMEMRRGNFASSFGRTEAGQRAGDLMDAVRITQAFKSVVGDSGTATRLSLQGLLNPSTFIPTLMEGVVKRAAAGAYMGRGGQLASELAAAPGAPGAAGAGGGLARGILGGAGLGL